MPAIIEDCFMDNKIGQTRRLALENLSVFGITPLRHILSPDVFLNSQKARPRASTILIPEIVFWLMATVAFTDQSMTGVITSFWAQYRGIYPWMASRPVTEEAFCIARKKLTLRFFKLLFSHVIHRYQRRFPDRYHWKGFRLLGIDGMKMTLPASGTLKHFFPPASNQQGQGKTPQGLLVGLVGLFDGICYDFKLTSSKGSEQKCARRMINRSLGPGDLLLCDKNFPDYHSLALIMSRGVDYLFRLQEGRFTNFLKSKTPSARSDEWYITLTLPKKLQSSYPLFPQSFTARVIRYQIKGFRPSLLITSLLDTDRYDYLELVGLYHERWRQETMHREWKYSLSMGQFRSMHVRGIFKEMYVQLIINNVMRWVMSEACEDSPYRPVDLRYLDCKRLILSYYHAMFSAPLEQLHYIYKTMLNEIFEQRILIREGRSYPRKNDHKARSKGNGKFVLPAKIISQETISKKAEINHVDS
jgi:hypothetical protein